MTEATTAPRRLARADREQQVLEVARRAFASRGFAAVTMGEIANEVGVTKPLLYAYFGNKERLFAACMEPAAEALTEAISDALARAENAPEALGLGVRAFFGFVDRDRDAWRVIFDETLPTSGSIAARVAEHRERIAALIKDSMTIRLTTGQRAHPQTAVIVEALSVSVLAAAEGLARWWLRTGALPAQQTAELLIATVEPGLRRVAAADPPPTSDNKQSTDKGSSQ